MNTERFTIPESEMEEKFIQSGGPGGQNVNKVATTVQLRFDIDASPSIPGRVKARLKQIAKHLVTDSGELLIEASAQRTQVRNREAARDRLAELIAEAAKPPPPKRRRTRPTKASKERRLKKKAVRGKVKKLRGKPPIES